MVSHRRSIVTLLLAAAWVLSGAPDAHAASPTVKACLAANEVSITLRSEHKLLESRTQLLLCADASCPADVRDACSRRMADVTVAIPTLVFEAKDPAGSDLTAVTVTMDGAPFQDHLDGTALAIDPGEHDFTFEVAGQPKVQKHLVLHEGEKERREPVMIGVIAPAPAPEPAPAVAPEVAPVPPPPAPPPAAPALPPAAPLPPFPSTTSEPASAPSLTRDGQAAGSSSQVGGYLMLGVGAAGLVTGGVFGLEALSSKKSSDAGCPSNDTCSAEGLASYNSAKTQAWISDVGFGVGLVSAVIGVCLLATSSSETASLGGGQTSSSESAFRIAPRLGPGQARLDFGGAW